MGFPTSRVGPTASTWQLPANESLRYRPARDPSWTSRRHDLGSLHAERSRRPDDRKHEACQAAWATTAPSPRGGRGQRNATFAPESLLQFDVTRTPPWARGSAAARVRRPARARNSHLGARRMRTRVPLASSTCAPRSSLPADPRGRARLPCSRFRVHRRPPTQHGVHDHAWRGQRRHADAEAAANVERILAGVACLRTIGRLSEAST